MCDSVACSVDRLLWKQRQAANSKTVKPKNNDTHLSFALRYCSVCHLLTLRNQYLVDQGVYNSYIQSVAVY